MTLVKICGLTSLSDAEACVDAGADALGINLWPGSKRVATRAVACEVATRLSVQVRVVIVLVDPEFEELRSLRNELGKDVWFQLHGQESPSVVEAIGPCVLKAFPVTSDVIETVAVYPPGEVLLDAAVPGQIGGTGQTADWRLAAAVQKRRPVWLAGGLRPGNVRDGIDAVAPLGVDVASGVESSPGIKDHGLVRAFINAVRASGTA